MNATIERINDLGGAFIGFALPMLIQSALLVLILFLVDLLLRKRVRAVFRYWMWMLVLVKLVLPTSLSSPVSVGRWFGDELAYVDVTPPPVAELRVDVAPMPVEEAPPIMDIPRVEAVMHSPEVVQAEPMMQPQPTVAEPIGPVLATPLSWQGMALLVWLAVLTAMLLLLLQRAFFVKRLVTKAGPADGKLTGLLARCCERMAVRRKVGLKISAEATSPAVCGLFEPVILAPENLTLSLSSSELRVVLLHELAHVKRRDLWVNLAQTLLQIFYFYNPLLWLANAMIRRAREQAVDEMVLVAMGEKARQYPQTLVNVAKLAFKRPALSLRLIGVVESKSALTGRIKHILNRPMPKTAKLGLFSLLTVVVVAAILLPMAAFSPGPPDLIIKGVVRDARTGKPIAGARVYDDGYGPVPSWSEIRPDERSEWGAITNSAGQYSFLTWPEHHSIRVEAPGYAIGRESLYDSHFTFRKRDEETINFDLEPEAVKDGPFGRVVDQSGTGVKGATVVFYYNYDPVTKEPRTRTVTSEGSGRIILPRTEPGEWLNAWISAPGFEDVQSARIEHRADGTYFPKDLIFKLRRLGVISGSVIGPDGRPLAAAPLSLTTLSKNPALQTGAFTANHLRAITDDRGVFVLQDVPPGTHVLYYPWEGPSSKEVDNGTWSAFLKPGERWPSAPVTGVLAAKVVQVGQAQKLEDIVIDLSKSTCRARGKVRDSSGRAVSGAKVYLCWKTNGDTTSICGKGYGPAITNSQGLYWLENLPPGDWHIWARHDQVSRHSEAFPVRLAREKTIEADLTLPGHVDSVPSPPGPPGTAQPYAPGQIKHVNQPRRIFLPDFDTRDVNGVLDLANGQMLSARGSENDDRYFEKLGRGDLAYEYARNKAGLLCLRGATMQLRADDGIKPLTPDLQRQSFRVYFLDKVPCRYHITTAEGAEYEVKILSVEKGENGRVEIEYRRTELQAQEQDKPTKSSSAQAGIYGGSVSVEVEPRSSREQAGRGLYRWGIAPPDGFVLDHGWFSLVGGEMKEHSGGGRDRTGTKKLNGFVLETAIEGGFLVLKMQKVYEGPDDSSQIATVTCRTTVPEGSQFASEHLSRYRPMTNGEYRSLWEGRFVRNGETVKTVVYCARIAAVDDEPQQFSPKPAGEDPLADRGVPRTRVLVDESRQSLPQTDAEISARAAKVGVEQLAHNADIDVEHDQVAAAGKGRLVATSRQNDFSSLDESNGPRIEKRIYDELVRWSEQQGYESEIWMNLVPWEKHNTFRGEFRTFRKSGRAWNRPKLDPPDVFLKVDLVKDGMWYVQGIEKQPKEWSSSLRLELLVAERGQISPDQYDTLRTQARRRFSAVRKPNSKWTTLLSNGARVELVGVSNFPSPGKQWWAPDGSQIGYDPVFHIQNYPMAYEFRKQSGLKRFEVAVAISWPKCPNENKIVDMFTDDVKHLNRGGCQADNEVIVQPVKFAANQKTFDVKITISTDRKNFETVTFKNVFLKPTAYESASGEPEQLKVDVETSQGDDARIVGRVVDNKGQPVAGAQVAVSANKLGVQVSHGRLKRMLGNAESRIVETDSEGDFDLGQPPDDGFDLIAVHDEGFAIVGSDDYLGSREIQLQPWGRIEGQLAPGRHASENKIWMAGSPNSTWFLNKREYRYETTCDADGRFVFEQVPPGWFEAGYLIRTGEMGASITSRMPFEVKAGETARITLGGFGCPVMGRFVPPQGYDKPIYFGSGLRSLITTRPDEPRPENYDRMTGREQQQWHAQWRKTDEYRQYRDAYWHDPNWRQYTFRISDDGSFRIEDVIAGKYDFTVWIEERMTGAPGPPEEIGSYYGTIEVQQMPGGRSDEPLDLGELELTMHEPLRVGDMAPLFEARTLDGKDLKLIDYRGKHVLLSFWQPVSHPEIERLQELYDAYHPDGRLEIIGFGGHDTLEEVKNYLEENPVPWPQIYTSGQFKAGIAKDYRIPGWPWIFLIGPDGTIAATGLRGEKLTSAVNEVIETASQISKTAPVEEEAPWGEPLNGLRMRVTAPAGTVYKRGMSLPLILEIQNVSEQLIPLNSLSGFLSFKVTDRQHKRLGVQGYLWDHIASWEGVNDSLGPGETISDTCYLERLRFQTPPTYEYVTLHFQLPTQTVVPGKLPIDEYSNPMTIRTEDSPFEHLLKSEDLREKWTQEMNIVYREIGFFSGNLAIHIDGKGRVTTVGMRLRPDAPIPDGRREYVADRDALDQLVRRLREFKLERLNVYDRKMFATDLVNVHLSLAKGGHVFSGEYELFGEKTKPVADLQKTVQEFLVKIVATNEAQAQGQSEEVLLEKMTACKTPQELLERFLELARAGDPAAGALLAENVDPEVTRLLRWCGGQANCEEMTAEHRQMRAELLAGLTEQRRQFYREVRIWPDRGDKATQVGPRAYARLLKSNKRDRSWIRTLLMRRSNDGTWQIAGLFNDNAGVNLHAPQDYLNPWSPATHPAWGEMTEYNIDADDLARGCYIDFDKRVLHRTLLGNPDKEVFARLGIDGKCGHHEVGGDGGLIGIDLLVRKDGTFTWGFLTPLNVQLAPSLWDSFGFGGGGPFFFKTREGNIGVMGVSGDVNNYYIKFKMLNPACLGSTGTILRAVQADPRETAAHFLVGGLCRHGELNVSSFARHPDLITKVKSNRVTFQPVRLDTVYTTNSVALAVTSKFGGDEYRRFVLSLSKEGDRWLVTDVQIEMKEQDGETLRNFMEEYPDVRIVPNAVREADSLLKTYEVEGFKFEAGFVPDKSEYVWGEPIHYFTYTVRNTGNKTLSFREGGDYRGGRSESHVITAVDANGTPVPVPEMWRMGGLVGVQKLLPGEVYTKMMPVSRRLTFGGPGVYTVTGKRTLILDESLGAMFTNETDTKVPTGNSFQLTIHPYSNERMSKVIGGLAAQIRRLGDVVPRSIEITEPTELSEANRLHLALTSMIATREDAALEHLSSMARDGSTTLRSTAVKWLGEFKDDRALAVVLEALDDDQASIRSAAAEALGTMSTDATIDVLIERLDREQPEAAGAMLRAMGRTKSPRVFDLLVESLEHQDDTRRRAAADALVSFGGTAAVEALKTCVDDDDMDFREDVVKRLAEPLRQPIDADWLVPVVRSRKGAGGIGDAPRLLRLYAGPKAVPALLSCLDFENPSIRSYYNYAIIYSQGSCQGGLRIPWNSDLNRDGTPEEIEQNQSILKKIKAWVEHYYAYRLDEKPAPRHQDWREEEKFWGEPADGISIRVRMDQRVWPEGLPQLIEVDIRDEPGGGSKHISRAPELLEVQVNGDWYAHRPPLAEPTMGIDAGHGSSFENVLLDEQWRRKSDNQPLVLKPRAYTLRLRLSLVPESQRTGLVMSRPIQFEVIETDQ